MPVIADGQEGERQKELEPRVFVVDDDRSVRTGLARLLATEDYAVERLSNLASLMIAEGLRSCNHGIVVLGPPFGCKGGNVIPCGAALR